MEFSNLMSQKSETESLGVFELDPASNSGENVRVALQIYLLTVKYIVQCTVYYTKYTLLRRWENKVH